MYLINRIRNVQFTINALYHGNVGMAENLNSVPFGDALCVLVMTCTCVMCPWQCTYNSKCLTLPEDWHTLYNPNSSSLISLSPRTPFLISTSSPQVIESPHVDDLGSMPGEVIAELKHVLKKESSGYGDNACKAFMLAMVSMIGGYRKALKFREVCSTQISMFR